MRYGENGPERATARETLSQAFDRLEAAPRGQLRERAVVRFAGEQLALYSDGEQLDVFLGVGGLFVGSVELVDEAGDRWDCPVAVTADGRRSTEATVRGAVRWLLAFADLSAR